MNIFVNFVLNLVFFYSLIARILRWVSIVQQKEYRLDRLLAFVKSSEGRAELGRIINFPLSKGQIKRPKLTPRSILVLTLTIVFVFITPIETLYDLAAMYVLIPIYVLLASFPTVIVAILITRYYLWQAQALINKHKPMIIGVSGSYGKTTTKILISTLLGHKFDTWHTPRSFNTPLSLAKAIATLYKGQKYLVIEYAAYRVGEIAQLANKFPPNLIVFTGINEQHLALFGSYENMLSAETELLQLAKENSLVYYNQSDPVVCQLVNNFPHLKTIGSLNVSITKVGLNNKGRLVFNWQNKRIVTQLVGKHYIDNVRLAIQVARYFGINVVDLIRSLEQFIPTQEFITTQMTPHGLVINDGKTSNPNGFLAGLDILEKLPVNKKVIISAGIVDLGSSETQIHRKIAYRIKKTDMILMHYGMSGKSSFEDVLKSAYVPIKSQEHLRAQISQLTPKDGILIEGKLLPEYERIIFSK